MNKLTEHTEQAKLINFCWNTELYPLLAQVFSIPNGAFVSKREAAKLRREGMKSGVPDLCLPVKSFNGEHQCLWVEMKRPDGKGVVSSNQSEFMARRREAGHCTVVANSAVEALIYMIRYTTGDDIGAKLARSYIWGNMVCP